MSSRKIVFSVFLLLATLSSGTTAGKTCYNLASLTPDCTVIYFTWQNLGELDLSKFRFLNLKKIEIIFCEITAMPILPRHSAFKTLRKLSVITNRNVPLPADYFANFRNISRLAISTGLTRMPELPRHIRRGMMTLDLTHNKISSIPDNYFNDFSKLVALYIQNNKISRLTPTNGFANLRRLRVMGIDQMYCDLYTFRTWRQIIKLPEIWTASGSPPGTVRWIDIYNQNGTRDMGELRKPCYDPELKELHLQHLRYMFTVGLQ